MLEGDDMRRYGTERINSEISWDIVMRDALTLEVL